MSINNNKIIVSNRYNEASIKFRAAWLEYMDHEERVKYEVMNLVTILEKDGIPRMKAIQKIINDHKDLKGFSKATIYRELPEDMKNKQLGRPNFSNEKLVQTNKESEGLKGLRDSKGTKEQSASNDYQEDQEVTYDSKFVNSLIAENEQLKTENFRLKKDYQELETKYKKLLKTIKSD